mgnify:CR=1 FL=1
MATSFQCFNCEHYTGGSKTGSHCKAYPEDKGKPIPEVSIIMLRNLMVIME